MRVYFTANTRMHRLTGTHTGYRIPFGSCRNCYWRRERTHTYCLHMNWQVQIHQRCARDAGCLPREARPLLRLVLYPILPRAEAGKISKQSALMILGGKTPCPTVQPVNSTSMIIFCMEPLGSLNLDSLALALETCSQALELTQTTEYIQRFIVIMDSSYIMVSWKTNV